MVTSHGLNYYPKLITTSSNLIWESKCQLSVQGKRPIKRELYSGLFTMKKQLLLLMQGLDVVLPCCVLPNAVLNSDPDFLSF